MREMNIPDVFPILIQGKGDNPKKGGCLVQVAGYLNDGVSWVDNTPCIAYEVRRAAIGANDNTVNPKRRQALLHYIPRMLRTGPFDVMVNTDVATNRLFTWFLNDWERAYPFPAEPEQDIDDWFSDLNSWHPVSQTYIRNQHTRELEEYWVARLEAVLEYIEEYMYLTDTPETITDEQWTKVKAVMV